MASSVSGWQARLALAFARQGQRTVLTRSDHQGPLLVQRPFYPEADGACHVYVLHPPGGLVGGDELQLEARLAPESQALLTTPAAGKCYRSRGAIARQVQILQIAEGASLEWLPQETILFSGAQVRSVTRVEISGYARFIGWEILCLGRPAAGEAFTEGGCRQSLEIWRDGVPLYLEQGYYQGGSELLHARWGLNGMPVISSLVCVGDGSATVPAIREIAAELMENEDFGVSQLDGILVCRYRGPSTERARLLFRRAWAALRPAVLGKGISPPRIWHT